MEGLPYDQVTEEEKKDKLGSWMYHLVYGYKPKNDGFYRFLLTYGPKRECSG